jgi:hypothetical protein
MGIATPVTSLRFYLEDDTATTGTSAGSGEDLTPQFTAGSVAEAQTLAAVWSQLFQRSCRLVQVGATPPYTPLYAPCTSCLTIATPYVPGIGY